MADPSTFYPPLKGHAFPGYPTPSTAEGQRYDTYYDYQQSPPPQPPLPSQPPQPPPTTSYPPWNAPQPSPPAMAQLAPQQPAQPPQGAWQGYEYDSAAANTKPMQSTFVFAPHQEPRLNPQESTTTTTSSWNQVNPATSQLTHLIVFSFQKVPCCGRHKEDTKKNIAQ